MKQGLDQSRSFQLLLVGADNTGKTSLISSFLEEDFVEGQSATKGVDIAVCKVFFKDWVKISQSDKSNILLNQFSDQCKDNVLKIMADSSISSPEPSYNQSTKRSSITRSNVLFTTVLLTQSMMTTPHSGTIGDSPYPQHMQGAYDSGSLITSLWDFAGQTVFHNSHSVLFQMVGLL